MSVVDALRLAITVAGAKGAIALKGNKVIAEAEHGVQGCAIVCSKLMADERLFPVSAISGIVRSTVSDAEIGFTPKGITITDGLHKTKVPAIEGHVPQEPPGKAWSAEGTLVAQRLAHLDVLTGEDPLDAMSLGGVCLGAGIAAGGTRLMFGSYTMDGIGTDPDPVIFGASVFKHLVGDVDVAVAKHFIKMRSNDGTVFWSRRRSGAYPIDWIQQQRSNHTPLVYGTADAFEIDEAITRAAAVYNVVAKQGGVAYLTAEGKGLKLFVRDASGEASFDTVIAWKPAKAVPTGRVAVSLNPVLLGKLIDVATSEGASVVGLDFPREPNAPFAVVAGDFMGWLAPLHG